MTDVMEELRGRDVYVDVQYDLVNAGGFSHPLVFVASTRCAVVLP